MYASKRDFWKSFYYLVALCRIYIVVCFIYSNNAWFFFFFFWIIVFLLHGKSWPQYTFRMTIVEKYLITEWLLFYSKSFSQTKVKKSLLPISFKKKKKSQIYCIESSYFKAFYYQEAQSFLFQNRFDFFSFRSKCDRCQVFLFIVRFTFEINWPITLFLLGLV